MPPKRKASPLSGMCFCITGTLSVSRAEFEKLLLENGATTAKTVTAACTHLVSAETGTKKCQDAEKKGATIVDEDWVRSQLSGTPAAAAAAAAPAAKAKAPAKKAGAKAAAAPTAAASADTGASVYLECDSSSGGKFWRGCVEGSSTHVTYGKVGTSGASQVKDHGSAANALKFLTKTSNEKQKKGYAECSDPDGGSDAAAPVPAPATKKAKKEPAVKAAKAAAAAAAPAAASSGEGASIYMECDSSGGGKFWRCRVEGNSTYVTYGKVGTSGSTQVKEHGGDAEAMKFYTKMCNEKSKKGYSEC